MTTHTLTPYLAQNYTPIPETGCWIWLGAWDSAGYGKLGGGKTHLAKAYQIGAHKAFYLFHKGEIPEGLFVCHKCDTKSCVKPDHLFLGTAADNMRDMLKKERGRWQRFAPRHCKLPPKDKASGRQGG